MFGIITYDLLFFVLPAALVAAFVITLWRYFSAKRENKKSPGTFSDETLKERKIALVVVSGILAVFVAVVVGLIAMLFTAVAFM